MVKVIRMVRILVNISNIKIFSHNENIIDINFSIL